MNIPPLEHWRKTCDINPIWLGLIHMDPWTLLGSANLIFPFFNWAVLLLRLKGTSWLWTLWHFIFTKGLRWKEWCLFHGQWNCETCTSIFRSSRFNIKYIYMYICIKIYTQWLHTHWYPALYNRQVLGIQLVKKIPEFDRNPVIYQKNTPWFGEIFKSTPPWN